MRKVIVMNSFRNIDNPYFSKQCYDKFRKSYQCEYRYEGSMYLPTGTKNIEHALPSLRE